ncbi:hypothetical protein [Arthrobacter sp. FW306-2-2C-D06B]|uniref:hypothetical protein n=1 Tax=Arthrobacter sp. FW306-2-2C-D06B TaxID=2879618 RepID=UPI001F2FF2D9|nr:hypothetical protein [Arthrobacter sp. FW306-2-2C-D06B]UKA59177.1 hypothetical protein LFT47_02135 [Arthrobacter sp. FW306-2-2C-D06B]
MIRKLGKARWTYECRSCDYTSPISADQFRAIEACHRHERSFEHASKPLTESVTFFANAITELGMTFVETIASAFKPLADALSTPQNRPHDPTLLHDRRKWGGR